VNKGKVTPAMRAKWKEQWEFIACNRCIFNKLNQWEENFIINIGENWLKKGKDLQFHQSIKLNQICNKYQ